jgi:hypothetical protein
MSIRSKRVPAGSSWLTGMVTCVHWFGGTVPKTISGNVAFASFSNRTEILKPELAVKTWKSTAW